MLTKPESTVQIVKCQLETSMYLTNIKYNKTKQFINSKIGNSCYNKLIPKSFNLYNLNS